MAAAAAAAAGFDDSEREGACTDGAVDAPMLGDLSHFPVRFKSNCDWYVDGG